MKMDLAPYRDEMIISTKAGYDMWPGPYGEWGSRKYMLASLDQSLKRMGLEYVDIFYHHRPDPNTPLEESMGALDQAVRSGKTPDARPMTPEQLAKAKRIPRIRTVRRALGLTQEEFSTRYHIPVGTLRDWEQGRSEPDQTARAYLTVIARDPEAVRRALEAKPG